MRKIVWLIIGLIIFSTSFAAAIELQPKEAPSDSETIHVENTLPYVPGEILVKYRPSATTATKNNITTMHGLTEKREIIGIGTTLFKLPQGLDVESALNQLKDDPSVEYAEPNYYAYPTATPNDPAFSSQWGLNNVGQNVAGVSGKPNADINAPEAWDLAVGNENIIIAIIDTGVDIFHPDIRPNLWINKGEMAGYAALSDWKPNGIDDDGNGYVDDIAGWDFQFNSNNPNDESRQFGGHGTHVAGIAAARGNNGAGVTGVNWVARIMALAAMDYRDGGLPVSNLADALGYAERMGAHVINLSLGLYQDTQTLKDAINAVNRAVIVCAAGNDGSDNDSRPHYPSSYSKANLIAVAATDQSDQEASFSNFGHTSVDVAAPGVRIYSTYSRFVDPAGYKFLPGTSMASPMVAGLAALVRAGNGALSPVQVVSTIKGSVDKLPTLSGRISTGGRINALRALQAAGVSGGSDDSDGGSGCFIRTLQSVH
jgi:subtilisin family serine protease